MEQFDTKNKRYVKLEVKNRKLSINDLYRDELRVLGIRYAGGDDYDFIDYSYRDALVKTGYLPTLANMISLHNALLGLR